ncbi:MAG: tRNA pseudouridine(55) synthase TruB [Alphaproteobacteria bacterium]
MARNRRGKPIHGWIAIDKPIGMTSARVVAQVKRLTGAAKVGHGGTLDPLATGVLPIACGEATKTVSYVMDGIKTYRFRVRWGEARDTDDAEGTVVDASDVRPSEAAIRSALPAFIGEIEQVPPLFSAIKINGERAYDLARAGTPPEMTPRRVTIHGYELEGIPDADYADFRVVSGKGAYIRALARDLARSLGTFGHIHTLRRTAVGPFDEDHAIPLDKLESLVHTAPAYDYLLPVATALDDIPALAMTEAEAHDLSRGQTVSLSRLVDPGRPSSFGAGVTVRVMAGGRVVALARIEGGVVHPLRILNL